MANVSVRRVGSNRVVSLPQRAADALVRYGTFEYAEADSSSATPKGRFAASGSGPVRKAEPKAAEASEATAPKEEVAQPAEPAEPAAPSGRATLTPSKQAPARRAPPAKPMTTTKVRGSRPTLDKGQHISAELAAKTKDEIVEFAKSVGMEVEKSDTKAALLNKLARYRRRDMRADK